MEFLKDVFSSINGVMNSARLRITSKMTELSFDRQESDYAFYSVMVSSNGEAPQAKWLSFHLTDKKVITRFTV